MRRYFITFIILLFIFANINVFAEITGETVTGEATNQDVNMSILISLSSSILSPENKTYLDNSSILLNYTSTGLSTLYNIDNLNNITLTSSPIYFSTTEGSHILYLYANNSAGEIITKNTTFYVNSSLLTIIYDEYKGGYKGDSTNFSRYVYEDLQSLSNIILEDSIYGKIHFNQAINITNDLIPNDGLVDIDSNSNISLNKIEINPTSLPNFNKPATIWMYNLTLNNPRILKDGVICPSSICTSPVYSAGAWKFNVTGFTVYSLEETPVIVTVTTPGGSGGSSHSYEPIKEELEVEPEKIKIKLKQGETKKQTFTIKNTGKTKKILNLSYEGLENFIRLSETEIELEADETKTIIIDFIAREDTIPNLYLGSILIKANPIEEKILIAIEVESKEALFDVKIDISKKFKYVMPGEEVLADIKLYNLKDTGKIDVNIDYMIKDENNSIIISGQETIAIELLASFTKIFQLPENTTYGDYVFYVKATYDGKIASASAWFIVGEKPPLDIKTALKWILILITITIIVVAAITQILKHKNKKLKKSILRYKKEIKKQSSRTDESKRLAEKIEVLEKAYARGHIRKESYEKIKGRIKNLLKFR